MVPAVGISGAGMHTTGTACRACVVRDGSRHPRAMATPRITSPRTTMSTEPTRLPIR